MKAVRFVLAGILGLALAASLGGTAFSASVTPEVIAETANQTCQDLAGQGQTWSETKVDPPANGTFTTSQGTITITNLTATSFDWSATFGIDAVFVKSGAGGSHLYRYDPPTESFGDTNLTTPEAQQQISHIAFCWDAGGSPSPSPSPSPSETESPSPSPTVEISPAGGATTPAAPVVLGVRRVASTGSNISPALPIMGFGLFALGSLLILASGRPKKDTDR